MCPSCDEGTVCVCVCVFLFLFVCVAKSTLCYPKYRKVLGVVKLSDIVQKMFDGKCSGEDKVQPTQQYKQVRTHTV